MFKLIHGSDRLYIILSDKKNCLSFLKGKYCLFYYRFVVLLFLLSFFITVVAFLWHLHDFIFNLLYVGIFIQMVVL